LEYWKNIFIFVFKSLFMTQIAAICLALLQGEVLTIGSGFNKLHCTNLPRELSRSVEQKFGVEISRDKTAFKSVYNGKPGYYFRYRLNRTEKNAPGIAKMVEYCKNQIDAVPKTDKQSKAYKALKQVEMFPVV
jgi:GrpB-like predicted nucleotidyltransferase (UPF0157 family)